MLRSKKFENCFPDEIPRIYSFGNSPKFDIITPTLLSITYLASTAGAATVTQTGLTIASLAATAGATTIGVMESRNAAKQAELNAEAESDALHQEAKRRENEFIENQRRLAIDQRRFRASQLTSLADTGFLTGTGTSLMIEADTWAAQQRELADQTYNADLTNRSLLFGANQALTSGQQTSRELKSRTAGTILGGLGSMAGTAISSGIFKTKNTTVPKAIPVNIATPVFSE